MFKPFLATAALLAIIVGASTVSHAQDASVLSKGSIAVKELSKSPNLRQIAVEPSGITAKADKRFPALALNPSGIPSDKIKVPDTNKLIVAPQDGIPSDEGAGPGIGIAPKIALPSDGIPSDKGAGNGGGKTLPIVIEPEGNPAPVIVDKGGKTGGTKTLPIIVQPEGNPVPEETFDPELNDTVEAAPETFETAPVETVEPAPKASAAPAIAAVSTPQDLYTLLTSRGYGVDVIKRDHNGNLVFLVKAPGHANDGYVLLVDGHYGKVLYRQRIDLADYGYGYDAHETHVEPSYTPAYKNGGDNCETESYGY